MVISQSAQPTIPTPIQQPLPQPTFTLLPRRSKFPLIIFIVSLLFLSGLIYFFLQAKSLRFKLDQNTTRSQTPATNMVPIEDEELRTLNYFNNELSDEYDNIIQLPPGHKIRRVSSIEGDSSWIVETSSSELDSQIRSIVEERDFFLFSPTQNIFFKLNSEPMLCYIEQAKKITMVESRLLISGPCNIGYFTKLYSYSNGQISNIPLSDPSKLLTNSKSQNTDKLIINADKASSGKLFRAINTNEESVFVVDIVNHDGFNPPKGVDPANPSKGLAIFDINSGKLKDLVIYNNY